MFVKKSSQTGSACRIWLPKTPTYSSRPSIKRSRERRSMLSWMKRTSFSFSSLSTTDAGRCRPRLPA
jgi:hypothetical protein